MFRTFYWSFFLLLLAFPHCVSSQEDLKARCDSIYGSNISIEDKIVSVNQLLENIPSSTFTIELAYTYHKLGLLHSKNGAFHKAVDKTLKAVQIKESLPNQDLRSLNNSLYNISQYLIQMEDIPLAMEFLEKVLSNKDHRYYYKACIDLAYFIADEGDYFRALEYTERVIDSFDTYEDPQLLAYAHLASIHVYSQMDMSLTYIDKINTHRQKIEAILPAQDLRLAEMFNNLGKIFYYTKDNYKEARAYFEKALPFFLAIEDTSSLGTLYNNIGTTFSVENQNDRANDYYNKALNLNIDLITRADIYNNQGFYLKTEHPKDKIAYYQKSLVTLLENKYQFKSLHQLPDLSEIKNSPYKVDLLHYLGNIAQAWVDAFTQDNDRAYLIHAKKTLSLIDQVVSLIRLDSLSNASKLFWINRGVDPYMLAVKVCFLLDDPDGGFYFMEKNKSLLLLEHLNNTKTTSRLETKIPQSEASSKLKITSLKQTIKTYVNKEENLIEYILNEKTGYGIFCSSEKLLFFTISDVPEVLEQIKFLKQQLSKPLTTKAAFRKYKDTAYCVFQKLFPFEVIPIIANKKLTIISDYELHNLPFSSLVIANPDDSINMDYLLKYCEVTYLQSISVFQQIKKVENQTKSGVVGFAPTIFKNDSLQDLLLSEQEMKKYTSLLSMDLRSREQATKVSFIESLRKASVIHLSTHAGYDQENSPWLSFFDDNISLNELYSLENSTDMIILDACKSSAGKMEMGEGIMSLSRAFFYGGAQSVIASNWNVNEKSNNKILHTFYENLKQGATKSSALHKAKLDFLNSAQLEQVSPYFWASLTLSGNVEPIKLSSKSLWAKPMVVTGLFLLAFLLLVKFSLIKFK